MAVSVVYLTKSNKNSGTCSVSLFKMLLTQRGNIVCWLANLRSCTSNNCWIKWLEPSFVFKNVSESSVHNKLPPPFTNIYAIIFSLYCLKFVTIVTKWHSVTRTLCFPYWIIFHKNSSLGVFNNLLKSRNCRLDTH